MPSRPRVYSAALSVSRVASGRASRRKGTKLVPSPRETWRMPTGSSKSPSQYGARRCSSRTLPPGIGMQIWPPCKWPARIRWKSPGARLRTSSGKWIRRMRKSASGAASSRRPSRRRRASAPATCTVRPATSNVTASCSRSFAPCASSLVRSAGLLKGSRVAATSWLPSTAYVPCRGRSRSSAARSVRSPRLRLTRSPVIATRSTGADSAQSTALRSVRALRRPCRGGSRRGGGR